MKTYRIGQYNKEVKGKKAILTQEVKFMTQVSYDKRDKKVFAPGTEIIAVHEVFGTGLTTFSFKHGDKVYQHPVREGKFQYVC